MIGNESTLQYINPSVVEICANKAWRTKLLIYDSVLAMTKTMVIALPNNLVQRDIYNKRSSKCLTLAL